MKTNELIMMECQLDVKVRKYQVDIPSLQKYLKESKYKSGYTNKQLAEYLKVPLTQIEHYFRTDRYFAIPEPSIWFQLKEILNINTNMFDESIMTFITQPGVYEKSNRIYGANGISPTIMCGDEVKILNIERE